jgi:hypothetical protein
MKFLFPKKTIFFVLLFSIIKTSLAFGQISLTIEDINPIVNELLNQKERYDTKFYDKQRTIQEIGLSILESQKETFRIDEFLIHINNQLQKLPAKTNITQKDLEELDHIKKMYKNAVTDELKKKNQLQITEHSPLSFEQAKKIFFFWKEQHKQNFLLSIRNNNHIQHIDSWIYKISKSITSIKKFHDILNDKNNPGYLQLFSIPGNTTSPLINITIQNIVDVINSQNPEMQKIKKSIEDYQNEPKSIIPLKKNVFTMSSNLLQPEKVNLELKELQNQNDLTSEYIIKNFKALSFDFEEQQGSTYNAKFLHNLNYIKKFSNDFTNMLRIDELMFLSKEEKNILDTNKNGYTKLSWCKCPHTTKEERIFSIFYLLDQFFSKKLYEKENINFVSFGSGGLLHDFLFFYGLNKFIESIKNIKLPREKFKTIHDIKDNIKLKKINIIFIDDIYKNNLETVEIFKKYFSNQSISSFDVNVQTYTNSYDYLKNQNIKNDILLCIDSGDTPQHQIPDINNRKEEVSHVCIYNKDISLHAVLNSEKKVIFYKNEPRAREKNQSRKNPQQSSKIVNDLALSIQKQSFKTRTDFVNFIQKYPLPNDFIVEYCQNSSIVFRDIIEQTASRNSIILILENHELYKNYFDFTKKKMKIEAFNADVFFKGGYEYNPEIQQKQQPFNFFQETPTWNSGYKELFLHNLHLQQNENITNLLHKNNYHLFKILFTDQHTKEDVEQRILQIKRDHQGKVFNERFTIQNVTKEEIIKHYVEFNLNIRFTNRFLNTSNFYFPEIAKAHYSKINKPFKDIDDFYQNNNIQFQKESFEINKTIKDSVDEILLKNNFYENDFHVICPSLGWCSCGEAPYDKKILLLQRMLYDFLENHTEKKSITYTGLASGRLLFELLFFKLISNIMDESKGVMKINLTLIDPIYFDENKITGKPQEILHHALQNNRNLEFDIKCYKNFKEFKSTQEKIDSDIITIIDPSDNSPYWECSKEDADVIVFNDEHQISLIRKQNKKIIYQKNTDYLDNTKYPISEEITNYVENDVTTSQIPNEKIKYGQLWATQLDNLVKNNTNKNCNIYQLALNGTLTTSYQNWEEQSLKHYKFNIKKL